ncbi:hypothetical protein CISIN_1g045916mg [Citrus sinensis]|uniref:Uncharacterized protein n=1 Tax=Citrus sinensis TaxID=2711 RepID=A0A067EU31_CITSI|nr:hypothetical protein CISIN_1g045916mg [Citrus sinensis]
MNKDEGLPIRLLIYIYILNRVFAFTMCPCFYLFCLYYFCVFNYVLFIPALDILYSENLQQSATIYEDLHA